MSPEEIVLVEATMADLQDTLPLLAATFYRQLFLAAPEARDMFSTDLVVQGEKFSTMLAYLVRSLRQWTVLEPASRDNGRRHAGYGVTVDHYEVAGVALLAALAEVSGPRWDDATERAWRSAYELLAELMLSGARAGATPAL
ncbi:globin family protein [Acidothermaceae bacterium B102]|nr:globin family protein [Acidothermaceae bacterium B102]